MNPLSKISNRLTPIFLIEMGDGNNFHSNTKNNTFHSNYVKKYIYRLKCDTPNWVDEVKLKKNILINNKCN